MAEEFDIKKYAHEVDDFVQKASEQIVKQRDAELLRFVEATVGSMKAALAFKAAGWQILADEDIGYHTVDGQLALKARFFFQWVAPE